MLQFAVPRRTFSFLAIVAIVGITLAIVVVERARFDLVQSNDLVIHTLRVDRAFQAFLAIVLDMEETCEQAVAAGTPAARAGCEDSQRLVDSQATALKKLTGDNPRQQGRLERLSSVIGARIEVLRRAVETSTPSITAAGAPAATRARDALTGEVRTLIQAGIEEEQRLLEDRQERLQSAIGRRTWLARFLIACLVFAVAGILYFWIRVRQLKPFVTLCAWSRTVKLGDEWVSFEVYLQRQFNIRVTHAVSPDELAKIVEENRLHDKGVA